MLQMNPVNKAQQIYPLQFQAARMRSREADAEITARAPWLVMDALEVQVKKITSENASPRAKFGKLMGLADRIHDAIAPSAICHVGCDHCCRIAVEISTLEAERISAAIGRAPIKMPVYDRAAVQAAKEKRHTYYAIPCTFLVEGRCSIYAVRPIACRVFFSLNDTPFFCHTDLDPEATDVGQRNLTPLWHGLANLMMQAKVAYADIREFFPPEDQPHA